MREVVLKLTTQKDLIKHQSEAATFGQLKKELRQVKWSGMRVVERSTKATLQMDDAILPQGDFVLFLVPEKVKSGRKSSGGMSKLPKPIEECSYNDCRSHMSWLNREKDANLDMSGSTAGLQNELIKYYDKNPAGKPAAAAKKPAAKKPEAAQKAAPKEEAKEEVKEEVKETKKQRKAREKREKAEKKEAVKTQEAGPVDPIQAIEDSRQKMNKAIDEIVLNAIEAGPVATTVLQYTVDDLEKEIKKVHNALKTSRSSAVYIQ